tara:strand:+ start:2543 stop:2950 length:408 start_codon:yes stop_codon:yes gene_type:complete
LNDDEIRLQNRTLLEKVISTIGTVNKSVLKSFYTEDWILELPYSDPPKSLKGKEEIFSYLETQMDKFDFRLALLGIHECIDPNLLIAEYASFGKSNSTNKPYENSYIGLWRFRDGRICGVKEYLNPVIAAQANMP